MSKSIEARTGTIRLTASGQNIENNPSAEPNDSQDGPPSPDQDAQKHGIDFTDGYFSAPTVLPKEIEENYTGTDGRTWYMYGNAREVENTE